MSTPLAHITSAVGPDGDQVDELIAQVRELHPDAPDAPIRGAFEFAAGRHAGQLRQSGEPFISHPVGVARICAQLGMDVPAIQAALLHDTVEDTSTSLDEVEREFGAEVAALVDGVTKLSKIRFESREERQAETYRKLVISMSRDVRVLILKLCDRLHNMRTLSYMGKAKQVQKAQETLEIYAPLAHRLGIQSVKWELEDLSFQALHPRRYREIQQLVSQRRADRESYVGEAGEVLRAELESAGILSAAIVGRAKHFYSIYEKMTRHGKAFNEIYDLTALRVLVDDIKDCYAVVGIVHSLWKPMPGRFKDFVAMPKINMYQSLHTTVIGPQGGPLEIQIRTHEMHRTAEFGVAAHWRYKARAASTGSWDEWVARIMEWQRDTPDSGDFVDGLRGDLLVDEVYVFTPKGELRSLPAGATPLDFAYDVHTDVGHRCVGAKVNGRIVPLSYTLRNGDFVEILTSKSARAPSRDWLNLVVTGKARSKIRAFFRRERREDAEQTGRDLLLEGLRRAGLPTQRMVASPLLAEVMAEMGFKKAEDFYIGLGLAKIAPQTVVNKLLNGLKAGEGAEAEQVSAVGRRARGRATATSTAVGVEVDGVADVMVRLAECCKAVPGDEIVGYISLGRGITVHREDCQNARHLMRSPERFTPVRWSGASSQSFLVEIAVDGWDRTRLLEEISRTFAEHGANIVQASVQTEDEAVRNRFTVEVGDVESLRHLVSALRNVDSVFDAYRVTPGH